MIAFRHNCNDRTFLIFYFYPKIECSPGYHWPTCNVSCRFPNYGNDCQSECTSCTEENCNHITGCTEISNVYIILKIPVPFQYNTSILSGCSFVYLFSCLSVRSYVSNEQLNLLINNALI